MKEQLQQYASRHDWDSVTAYDTSVHLTLGGKTYIAYDASLGAIPDCIWLARMTEPGWRMKVSNFEEAEEIAWECATNKTKVRL